LRGAEREAYYRESDIVSLAGSDMGFVMPLSKKRDAENKNKERNSGQNIPHDFLLWKKVNGYSILQNK